MTPFSGELRTLEGKALGSVSGEYGIRDAANPQMGWEGWFDFDGAADLEHHQEMNLTIGGKPLTIFVRRPTPWPAWKTRIEFFTKVKDSDLVGRQGE